jgi:single-strand DNA-binding protein
MLNINRVMITGRLTRDPETKYLPSGMAVTNLGLAVSRPFKDKSGEWREEVAFIDVEAFGKVAERIAETGRKGQPVYVEGRLKQDTWERDGQKQSKIRVSADIIKSFDVPQRGGQNTDAGESESYQESYQSQPSSRPAPQPQQQRSAAPSDGLHFDGGSNVSDDVPF